MPMICSPCRKFGWVCRLIAAPVASWAPALARRIPVLRRGDRHGSDLADDASADARIADTVGDLGDHDGRQLVGAQPGDRGGQSAFEVEAGALDDVQAGLLGHPGDPGKIGPDPDA
jgi:hypothetical protein